jgi:hypothetical protein
MSDKIIPEEPEHVACEVCMKQIPEDVAKSFECEEHLVHFCGLACYTQWQQQAQQENQKKNG